MSYGTLRVLNGALKGKEYLVSQSRLRIGRSSRNEIALPSYGDIADRHALLRVRKGEVSLSGLEPALRVEVNEQRIAERTLKYRDVIRIGSCKLFFQA
jgi:pSer/pThr/pTyr-binding forkhead associated (FHA) protein